MVLTSLKYNTNLVLLEHGYSKKALLRHSLSDSYLSGQGTARRQSLGRGPAEYTFYSEIEFTFLPNPIIIQCSQCFYINLDQADSVPFNTYH